MVVLKHTPQRTLPPFGSLTTATSSMQTVGRGGQVYNLITHENATNTDTHKHPKATMRDK